ncbi:hypothetical protein Tco_1004324 [Tanacetum coccineum]|uniref:Retroviral polymerase SH3-like domain-containing protein n=1 Tax=Tanacetum coccineum TaxID=301880 RepID=A0ABQ5FBY9_9ASTR
MHFLLSSMSVVYMLTTSMPEDEGDNPAVEQVRKRARWDNDDYVCRGLIRNEVLVSNFTNYKMTDSRPIMEQYNELLSILGRFTQHKMNIDETIQVSCIIDKLPPSWKDFKHTLKHLKDELTLVELDSYLHIEESIRVYNDNKGERKHHDNTKADPNMKPKVTCWKCGKPRHLKRIANVLMLAKKPIDDDVACSAFMSTSKLNDLIMWHARLGHVHFKRMHDMSKDRTDRGGLSQGFWGEAMLTACYLLNRVWGCMAVVRLPDSKLKTLGERGIECIFVRYVEHSKIFRFFVIEPNESVLINLIIKSRDAIFDENRFSSVPRPSQRSLKDETEDIGGSVVPEKVIEDVVQQPEPELRERKRNRTPKNFGPEFQLYLIKRIKDEVSDQHFYCFNVENDLKTFDAAMKS